MLENYAQSSVCGGGAGRRQWGYGVYRVPIYKSCKAPPIQSGVKIFRDKIWGI